MTQPTSPIPIPKIPPYTSAQVHPEVYTRMLQFGDPAQMSAIEARMGVVFTR